MLGRQLIRLAGCRPTLTLHQFLRTLPGSKGTKEGCAEGDCGACTVLVGAPGAGGGMSYKAINSCILFVASLDGKHVLTVEDLGRDDRLHPAQRAMIEHHGSQCGYCTPGFVMSLAALHGETTAPSRAQIDNALSGNLCRCTGYGPIIEAARRMSDYGAAPGFSDGVELGSLASADDEPTVVSSDAGEFFIPRTGDQLARMLQDNPEATLLAGGTDVGLWVTKMGRQLPKIIYLGSLRDLREISDTARGIDIPAAASLEEALPYLSAAYPGLATLMRRFASKPIRNSGTVCGNIANGSPIGDLPPPLIALGAELVLRKGPDRRKIRLQDFFIAYGKQDRGPGEFVERVILPKLEAGEHLKAIKISKRYDQDISAVCAALFLRQTGETVREVRIAFGGMAATPCRAGRAEAILRGNRLSEGAIDAAVNALAQDYAPISDMRASNTYRLQAAQGALQRMLRERLEGKMLPTVWEVET